MNGCIYRTKDGECDLYAEGGKYHAFCVGDEPCEGRKLSNADRIRAMTDEELAEWIKEVTTNALSVLAFGSNKQTKNIFYWLEWLKAEAEGEDTP